MHEKQKHCHRLAHEFKFTSWTVFPPNASEARV